MEIKIDPEQVQGLVEQAILASLDETAREAIMAAAIKALLTPVKPPYGGGPDRSPLTAAFDGAVHQAARAIVEQQIKDDPKVQEALTALVSAPIAALCKGNYDGLPEKIGDAIGNAVADWLRDRGR